MKRLTRRKRYIDENMKSFKKSERYIDEKKSSKYLVPGTGLGYDVPAQFTETPPDLNKGINTEIDFGQSELKASPGFHFKERAKTRPGEIFQSTVETLSRPAQTFRNLLGRGKEANESLDKLISESAKETRKKAFESGEHFQKGEYLKGGGKYASAVVAGLGVPFLIFDEEVSGKPGETVGKTLGLPFEVLHHNIANGLAISGMDGEDSSNYAEGLATLVLFLIRSGKEKNKSIEHVNNIADGIKQSPLTAAELKLYTRYRVESVNATMGIGKFSKSTGKESIAKLSKIEAKYNEAIIKGDKKTLDSLKKEADIIRKKERNASYQEAKAGKGAFIDPGALFKNKAEKKAYDLLKSDVKNLIAKNKGKGNLNTIIDSGLQGFFIDDPIKNHFIKEQMISEINQEKGTLEIEMQEIKRNNIISLIQEKGKELGIDNADKLFEADDFSPLSKRDIAIKNGDLETLGGQYNISNIIENIPKRSEQANEIINSIADDFKIFEKTEILQEKLKSPEEQDLSKINILKDLTPKKQEIKEVKEPIIETKVPEDLKEFTSEESFTELFRAEKTDPELGFKGKSVFGEGIYFTPTKEAGDIIKAEGSKLDKFIVPKDTKILRIDIDNMPTDIFNRHISKGDLRDFAINRGYDGIRINTEDLNLGGDQVVIFNKEKFPTKETKELPIRLSRRKSVTEQVKDKKLPTVQKIKETKDMQKLANEIQKISKQPNVENIVKLLNKSSQEIVKKATDFAMKKNMISKEEGEFFIEAITKKTKEVSQAPTGRISNQQKLNILDMLGYDKVFKKLEETKINVPQLSESLKNIGARLHVVNTPEGQRVKLPFSLMGNKSATFEKVLLPMIKKATKQGADTYVEPFGGAGTVYYFADEMINSGIEKLHVNHFDNEKYQTVKAIKDGKLANVSEEVNKAFDTIVDDIGLALADIPEIKEIMDSRGVQVGTKEFKEIAELSFYPQYAKQFFEERPDTKLAVKGETTETFKDWLRDKLKKEAEKDGKTIQGEELETALESVLSDRSVFENQYPKISKRISDILNEYDNINIKDGDYKNSLLVSMARHFRQRGDSGQRVVSASGGFQNVLNSRDKMVEGLSKYKSVFDKHGDKINIYNQDGKKFISNMGKDLNNPKTITYLDPPYIRTTGVYIKNQPPEVKGALAEYADPTKINQLFSPMKDSIMMFTNDIDGKYFETLDKMLDGRMSKDIIGYREGTTPTSLVTTNEIAIKPKDVGLSYYTILKDSFTKNIMKSLKEGLLPKISAQQKKVIAKFEQHFMELMQQKFGDIAKIQDQQFKGKKAFDDLKTSIETVVTGKDKQNIISEAKKWLKQNIVTGSDVVKLIDKINKLWVDKQQKAKDIRNKIEKLRNGKTIDVESKKIFFDKFNAEYIVKKISDKKIQEAKIIDKIMAGEDFTATEYEVMDRYLTDSKFYDKINEARKTSIYNLDIDSMDSLIQEINYFTKVGKTLRKFREQELNKKVEEEIIKAEPNLKKLEEGKRLPLSERLNKINRYRENAIEGKITTKRALLYATPSEWVFDEEMNISKAVYNLTDKSINKHRDFIEKIALEFNDKTKEFNITKEGWKKITLHGLSRRTDGKGKIKIIAQLKADGMDAQQFSGEIKKFSAKSFLSENQQKMYDYMQGVFKELGTNMRDTKLKLDNEYIKLMDEYFPIQLDYKQNKDKFQSVDPQSIDNGSSLYRKVKTAQGFTKEATGLEVIPELNSEKIFQNHVNNASYYIHMQKSIIQLNKFVNELGTQKLGKLGFEYMKEYVNILARQGIIGNQNVAQRMVAGVVRNFQTAVLGYNPVTVGLQTSAILEAIAVGGNFDIKAYYDIGKAVVGKKDIWDMVTQKSGTIRNREYRNLFGNETDKFDKGLLEKWNKYGFWGIQKADAVISRIVWYSEYKRSQKQGLSEQESVYNADTIIKKSMGHTHFEGKTQFVLENERTGASPFTIFQNFVLNHSAIIRYGGGKNTQKKYGKILGYMYALAFAGLLFGLYEELIRKGGAKLQRQKDYDGPLSKAFGQLFGFFPYVGIMYGLQKFSNINISTGAKNIATGLEGIGKDGVETKDIAKIMKGLGIIMGIGGTAQLDRIYKGYIQEETKSKKKKTTSSSNRTRRTRRTRRKR